MPERSLDVLVRILTEEVGEGKANEILDKYRQSATEVGEELGKLEVTHREWHKILLDLGNTAIPGVGRAVSELALGPVGAVLALLGAFEMLQKKIEEIQKQEDDLNETELSAHVANINALRQAWSDALTEYLKYQQAVAEAGEEKDPLANQLKRIKAVSDAQTEAHLKAMKELGEQRVAFMEAHPDIFSAGSIAAAKEGNERAQDAVKNAGAQKDIAAMQADIDQRKQLQPQLDAATSQAQAKALAVQNALNTATTAKAEATDPKKLEEAQKKVDAAEAQAQAAMAIPEYEGMPGGGTFDNRQTRANAIAAAQQNYDAALAEQKRMAAAAKQAQDQIDKANADKVGADAALAEAKRRGTENAGKITEESGEVETQRAVQGAKQTGQQTDAAAKDFATAKGIADTLAAGGTVSASQAAYLQQVEKAITGYDMTLKQAATAAELQGSNQELAAQMIERAAGRIMAVEARLRSIEARFNTTK